VTRNEFDNQFIRGVLALRTELAYPSRRRFSFVDLLVDRGVLSEIIAAYPQIWICALKSDRAKNERCSKLFKRNSPLTERMPLKVFNVLLRLARGELAEQEAIQEIQIFYAVLKRYFF